LIEIWNNCLNLKKLCIKNSSELTDKGLIEIAKKCLKLEHIDIECNNITDLSLIEVSRNYFNLKKINAHSCKNYRKWFYCY
jgi:hypothetical protein